MADPQELRSKLAETRQRLDALLAERSGLALPAVNGNLAAEARIIEIDRERVTLASREETINQALVALKYGGYASEADATRARQLAGFERSLPRLARQLTEMVREGIDTFCGNVQRLIAENQINMAARFWMGVLDDANTTWRSDDLDQPAAVVERLKKAAAVELAYVQDAHLKALSPDLEARMRAGLELQQQMVSRLLDASKAPMPISKEFKELYEQLHNDIRRSDDAVKEAEKKANRYPLTGPMRIGRRRSSAAPHDPTL